MNVGKVTKIIRFEIYENLMSKSFLWAVVLLPVIICFTSLIGVGMGKLIADIDTGLPLGLVDKSGALSFAGGPCEYSKIGRLTELPRRNAAVFVKTQKEKAERAGTVICFQTLEEAKPRLIEGGISQLIAFPADFPASTQLQIYTKDEVSFHADISLFEFENFLREHAIAASGVSESTKVMIQGSYEYERYILDESSNFVLEEDKLGTEVVPEKASRSGLRMWGILIVLMSGSIGYGCTRAERTTKLIEIILSSVTSTEYLLAKVLASTVFTISLITAWSGIGFLALTAVRRNEESFSVFDSLPQILNHESLWMIAFTLVGAICTNLFGAAFGLLSKPNEEKNTSPIPFAVLQQAVFIISIFVAINPKSTFAVVTSLIPPISGPVMISRLGSGELSQIQILLPMLVLVLGVILVLFVAARLMSVCLQLEGQRFNPIRVWKTIWS